jgi:hypothetical protein
MFDIRFSVDSPEYIQNIVLYESTDINEDDLTLSDESNSSEFSQSDNFESIVLSIRVLTQQEIKYQFSRMQSMKKVFHILEEHAKAKTKRYLRLKMIFKKKPSPG